MALTYLIGFTPTTMVAARGPVFITPKATVPVIPDNPILAGNRGIVESAARFPKIFCNSATASLSLPSMDTPTEMLVADCIVSRLSSIRIWACVKASRICEARTRPSMSFEYDLIPILRPENLVELSDRAAGLRLTVAAQLWRLVSGSQRLGRLLPFRVFRRVHWPYPPLH